MAGLTYFLLALLLVGALWLVVKFRTRRLSGRLKRAEKLISDLDKMSWNYLGLGAQDAELSGLLAQNVTDMIHMYRFNREEIES